jgi:predicted enzyme related to lactoylglutathione lyase
MHQSRLCAIMIDCQADSMEAGVQFWSQALGIAARRAPDASGAYVTLEDGVGGLQLHLQRVHSPSRIHLDIETDNVEAEVQRLEKLGARRTAHIEKWWVMEAPSGHLFCVVPVQSEDFPARSHTWEE